MFESSPPPMHLALALAVDAASQGEVPVGTVVVNDKGEVIAEASNLTETLNDPTAHAELLAIRRACAALGTTRLENCDLYVTLEPCAMCAAAISHARIRRLYFGAYDPKGGAIDHGPKWFQQPTCLHRPEVFGGFEEVACGDVLKKFFQKLRE